MYVRFFAPGRLLTGVALFVLLAGCGNNGNTNQQIGAQPTSTSVQSTAVNSTGLGESSPPQSLLAQNPGGVYQLNDPTTNSPVLQVDATTIGGPYPITCTVDYDEPTNVVLATNRLTYDTGEIQSMANAFDTGGGWKQNQPLPSTLQTVSGDTAGVNIPSWGDINHGFANDRTGGCSSTWTITNKGNDPIQITQIQARFATDSKPNNYHYRLIDVCSLPGVPDSSGYCEHSQGAGAEDHTYIFHLKPGSPDTAPIQGETTNQFFLDSGASATVAVIFLPADSSSYQIYSITPEFVVDNTANGSTFTLSVPQLTSTISFIPPSNLSCYQLHGNTFMPLDMTGPDEKGILVKVFCL